MNIFYTLDKLVVLMREDVHSLMSVLDYLRRGAGDTYGLLKTDKVGYGPARYHDELTIEFKTGDTMFLGVQPNCERPNEYWVTCKLEFNPAKVGNLPQFDRLYNKLLAGCKYLDFKRFDVAIDLPVARSAVHIFKDRRSYRLIDNGGENKTEYLGVRSSHGQVKLYNKALESKLDYDLTRLEITMYYESSSWFEFKAFFPKIFVLDGLPKELDDTNLVLCLACLEHPEYLKMISRYKRKKIEQLLREAALEVKPDEVSYRDILAQILTYGNGLPIEKFVELEENEENPFVNGEPEAQIRF